ncbi:MAG: ice-binding family protein [Tahibacter sp.]
MNKIIGKFVVFAANAAIAALLGAAVPAFSQTAPPLGQAGGFAVLGGSAISNTGATVITGDLGIWPNTASSISGFPPGIIIGTTHAGDAVAMQAQNDLTTAYNFVAGQACNTDLTGQDLGGLTLTPGVYCFSTSAQLTGTLTLDAQSNPNAVFLFKIGSTLTTASNSQVQVINGGSNCNVYWQVGSSATLGTATAFAGNILALTSITATTGSSMSGRALARNGAVTLDTNTVAVCAGVGCPTIAIAPVMLPAVTVGASYSQSVAASGGTTPYTFTVTAGALPPGLNLVASGSSSALISGVPTLPGSYSFSLTATDAVACAVTQSYTILVNPSVVVGGGGTSIPTLSIPILALLAGTMVLLGMVGSRRRTAIRAK